MNTQLLIALLIAFAGWVFVVWLMSLLAKQDALLKGVFALADRFRTLIFLLALALVVLFLLVRLAPRINLDALRPRPTASPAVSRPARPTASAPAGREGQTNADTPPVVLP